MCILLLLLNTNCRKCRKETKAFEAVIVDLQGIEHAAAVQLAKTMRKEADQKSMPLVALSFPLSTATQQELEAAGFSLTLQKPVRQTTLAVGLLQAVGVQLRTASKKVDSKMLAGKQLLVVCMYVCMYTCIFGALMFCFHRVQARMK